MKFSKQDIMKEKCRRDSSMPAATKDQIVPCQHLEQVYLNEGKKAMQGNVTIECMS